MVAFWRLLAHWLPFWEVATHHGWSTLDCCPNLANRDRAKIKIWHATNEKLDMKLEMKWSYVDRVQQSRRGEKNTFFIFSPCLTLCFFCFFCNQCGWSTKKTLSSRYILGTCSPVVVSLDSLLWCYTQVTVLNEMSLVCPFLSPKKEQSCWLLA